LCAVGALRTLGFLLVPILAAVGRPSRVLVYNAVAAVVLSSAFVIAGVIGNDFIAIAWAWAIGYPIAFATLAAMALPAGGVTIGAYARALYRIAAAGGAALVAGLIARDAVAVPLARAIVVAVTIVAVDAILLARLEGITPTTIARGFRASRASVPPARTVQ
jgi:hypothetical protein